MYYFSHSLSKNHMPEFIEVYHPCNRCHDNRIALITHFSDKERTILNVIRLSRDGSSNEFEKLYNTYRGAKYGLYSIYREWNYKHRPRLIGTVDKTIYSDYILTYIIISANIFYLENVDKTN